MLIYPKFITLYLTEQNIYGKKITMINEFPFVMYNPVMEIVYETIDINIILSIDCRKCNSNVLFEEDFGIAYLYRLVEDSPSLYAKLALTLEGLQHYVDTIRNFN